MLLELLFAYGLFPLCLTARGQSSLKATYRSYWVSVIAINEEIVHNPRPVVNLINIYIVIGSGVLLDKRILIGENTADGTGCPLENNGE